MGQAERIKENACEVATDAGEFAMVVGVFFCGTSDHKTRERWNAVAHKMIKTIPDERTLHVPMFLPTENGSARM